MAEDWLDQEIESLRELVEGETGAQRAQEASAPAHPSPWRPLAVDAMRSAHRVLLPPIAGLRRARRFVRTHSFDLVFYAFSFGITMLSVGIVLWMSSR